MLGREHLLPFSRLLNVKKTRMTRTYGRLQGTAIELQATKEDLQPLKEENDKLKAKLDNEETLKCELFMGDVLTNDESVKLYTGFPSPTMFNDII